MRIATLLCATALAACGSKNTGNGDGGNGDGNGGNGDGPANGSADAAEQCGDLTAVLRDFKSDHPDFEKTIANDRGLVQPTITPGGKPVYAPSGATATVSGQASFDQWYRDVAGVNMHFEIPIVLTEQSPGHFVFDDQDFFPLDGMGWPNQEIDGHNFHFTTEIHGTFHYMGGENFTFTGDDDLFLFVNGHLAIDLGGVHGAQSQSVDFDAQAGALGITVGNVYALDVFHAERHTSQSTFRIETSIGCLVVP